MCKLLDIDKARICPYNPQSDGMIERFNRSLIAMLTMFVVERQKDWDDHLPYVMFAYRSIPHKSSGLTPNLLMLNREVDCLPPSKNKFQCEIDYVEWVRKSMLLAFEFSNQHMGIAAKRQKRDYNRGLKPRDYTPGQ